MKINSKQIFVNLRKETILIDGRENEPLILGAVIADILLTKHKDKPGFRPLESWKLAKKFYENEEVEINQHELKQIKELVDTNEFYNPMIIAQTIEMLEKIK